jgi:hypothetical protein
MIVAGRWLPVSAGGRTNPRPKRSKTPWRLMQVSDKAKMLVDPLLSAAPLNV